MKMEILEYLGALIVENFKTATNYIHKIHSQDSQFYGQISVTQMHHE